MGDTLSPSSPPRHTSAELQQRSNLSDIVIPGKQRAHQHIPLPRLAAVGTSTGSHAHPASSGPPQGAAPAGFSHHQTPATSLSQWPQQSQSQSQSRTSNVTTTSNGSGSASGSGSGSGNKTNHLISPTATASASASPSTWSPVSITATAAVAHPLGAPATIRLSPQVEEDIKAAVLEAAAKSSKSKRDAHGNSSGKNDPKIKSRSREKDKKEKKKKTVRRAPDGRRESPQTTRNWLIAKKVLRWVSLTICAMMVVGEAVLAIFDGAYADTTLGICLGFLLGIWDTVRLVRLRLKRDIEPVSIFHLVAEGTFTVAIIVAVACIVDQVRRFWAGEFLIRGWVFSAGMLVQEGIHITLFARACVDKYLHRDAVDFRRYHGWELPWYTDPQPTEIVVRYVHVCPRCECEFSPHNGDDDGVYDDDDDDDADDDADAENRDEKTVTETRYKTERGEVQQPQSGVPSVVVT